MMATLIAIRSPVMRRTPRFALSLSIACSLFDRLTLADDAAPRFAPEGVRSHVTFLADDLLEGRRTGSRGHEIAANYVAAQFAAYGLQPGGTGGWFQRVGFQRTSYVPGGSFVSISGPKGEQRFVHGGE